VKELAADKRALGRQGDTSYKAQSQEFLPFRPQTGRFMFKAQSRVPSILHTREIPGKGSDHKSWPVFKNISESKPGC